MSSVPASRSASACSSEVASSTAPWAETDVTVRVDETGQHPAGHGLRVAAGGAGEGDPAVDDPDLGSDVVGPDEDRPAEVQHRGHRPTLSRPGVVGAAGVPHRSGILVGERSHEATKGLHDYLRGVGVHPVPRRP